MQAEVPLINVKKTALAKHLISPLAIAPMIDWTFTHFRVLLRLLAPHALLYTEMQTIGAVCNNPQRALLFQPREYPLALQLGGADISGLVQCAKRAEEKGFAEINLNLGCPSDKVQAGRFGACLMAEPDHVACCIEALKNTVAIPVTAKTRIGIDQHDSYEFFSDFAHRIIAAGCDKLIVHARKAWLHGLNPKQNRTIPPINYDFVYRLKKETSAVPIVINGNITTIAEINQHMQYVDGVMLGRLVCQNPYALTFIHQYFYPGAVLQPRHVILRAYARYMASQFTQGVALSMLLKPLFNFAHGLPGAKYWKEQLTQMQQLRNIAGLDNLVSMIAEMEQ